jgi:hypothetical protein
MRTRRIVLSAISCFAVLGTAGCDRLRAADPTEEELKNQLAIDLPAYWRASDLSLEASQRSGANQFRGRFKADIELTSPTYQPDRRVGDVLIVQQTGNRGEKKTVYGRVEARRERGSWVTELRLDNDPTSTVGLPREFIRAPRVLVAGSREEQEFLREQEAAREEARLAEAAERLAARQRWEDQLVGEWHGSMFTETDSRLIIRRETWGMVGTLYHQGHVETLSVEFLAGSRILLTGTDVRRMDGKRVNYNLDTFDLEMSGDGSILLGAARDRGGANGAVSLRKVTA